MQQHVCQDDNAAFMFLLDAKSAYDTVSHRSISMACNFFAVPADVESMLLAHVGGHSRVVNTAYGLGEEDTKITLDGGLAQDANSSLKLFIFTTAPAHRYADENLQGYKMPQAKKNNPGGDPTTCRVGFLNYADDDAGLNGRAVTTVEEVEDILRETNLAADVKDVY